MRTPITRIEKVTGVFVLLVLGVTVAALFVSAQRHGVFGYSESRVIHVLLEEGYGLKKGSPVMLRNMEVGVVNDLYMLDPSPHPDRPVRVDLRIEGKHWKFVYRGTTARIDRQLIGGTKVELVQPTGTAYALLPPLKHGDEVEPEILESVMEKVEVLKRDVQEIKGEVVQTLKNVQKTIENIRIVTDGLATGKGIAGRFLQDEQMAGEVTAIISDLKVSIADLRATIKTVQASTESVPAAVHNVGETTDKVNRLVDELPKIVASLERSLADVEVIVANVREASAGVPAVARKTDQALTEANRTIEGLQETPPLKWAMPGQKALTSEFEALPRGGPR